MKMMEVEVYSGYGEMDVCSVEVMEVSGMVEGLMKVRMESLKELMMGYVECDEWSDEIERGVMRVWSEFYSMWNKLNDDVYSVSRGEENIIMLIGEGSEWFSRLEEGYSEWSDEIWEEWIGMCNDEGNWDDVKGGWLYSKIRE